MKLTAAFNWRIFKGCLAVSFGLAWVVDRLSDLGYWASWGIVMFAWIAVGISTFADDDEAKSPAGNEPENNRNV